MFGQAISLPGTWMQSAALSWLVLTLSHSATMIGLVLSAQFTPVLLFGAYGGVVADRLAKRRLLVATQTVYGLLACTIGILVAEGWIELWMVFVVAVGLGLATAVDNPARQSFVMEMVGGELVTNAVALNSILVNGARVIGPAFGGALIATVGISLCFFLNAISFVPVVFALLMMRTKDLESVPPKARAPGQLRSGLRYVRSRPALCTPLLMMALIGTFTFEFPVILPLLAHRTLHAGPETFGALTAAMGFGAICGGLALAGLRPRGVHAATLAAAAFGVATLLVAFTRSFAWALVSIALTGAASIAFMTIGNSSLQLASDPSYRGRVMALWTVAFLGSTPIGAPIIGLVADRWGPPAALVLGACACGLAVLVGVRALRVGAPGLQ
jgi:MFS family permease